MFRELRRRYPSAFPQNSFVAPFVFGATMLSYRRMISETLEDRPSVANVLGRDKRLAAALIFSVCSAACGGVSSDSDAGADSSDAQPSFDATQEDASITCRSRLIFENDRTGDAELYAIERDGTGLVNLTNTPGIDERDPSLAPNGTLIFTARNQASGATDVFSLAANTRTQITTEPTVIDRDPLFSPDGNLIAVLSGAINEDVVVMNADGTNQVSAASGPGQQAHQAWSPSSDQLAYRDSNGSNNIFRVDADGSNPFMLTTNLSLPSKPQWSPNGGQIVYRAGSPNTEIFVTAPAGTGQTNLTNHPDSDVRPSWSPDGLQIAWVSSRSGEDNLWMMNSDGSNPTQLTTAAIASFVPVWSPMGTHIAFVRGSPALGGDLFVIEIESKSEAVISASNGLSLPPIFEACP